jgi:hypothetical protein
VALGPVDAGASAPLHSWDEYIVFLMETFSGNRNYYACVADTSSLQDRIEPIRASYPQHTITVTAIEDKAWKFYNSYRQDFPW